MLDSTAIRMQAEPGRGMYESFYFRGTSTDGRQAFWLKHNMLRLRGSDEVWMEAALILFDRCANRTSAVYSREAFDRDRFARMSRNAKDWEHVALQARNGSSVEISRNHLAGDLVGEGGRAHWNLQLRRSGMKLLPLAHEAMYEWRWPPNKILTRDCHLDFQGSVWAGELAFSGTFHGMNGHNWGTGHAPAYAYANCAEFRGHDGAYFDGFSARLGLGPLGMTPFQSLANLAIDGEWHRFNLMRHSLRRKATHVGDYAWRADVANASHRLEIDVDGGSPDSVPWVALHYGNPDRKRSVVKNTKFATLKLRLSKLGGGIVDELFSDVCEFESLLPANRPAGDGYLGQA